MINIICVKEGNKYSSDYVNRLHLMCRIHLEHFYEKVNMRFMCYTDDPRGIDRDIEILPIPDEYHLGGWWDKLGIFRKGLIPNPNGFKVLYLDLDTVIQQDLKSIIDFYCHEAPVGVHLYWDETTTNGNYQYKTLRYKIPFNSSVMLFYPQFCYEIWDKFWKDPNHYIFKYYGDDKFLGNEFKFQTFPKGWIYSRLYGMDPDNMHNILCKVPGGSQEVAYYPDAKICLMNGPTTPEHYTDLERYWMHK